MLNVSVSNDEVLEIISQTVNDLMEENRKNFEEAKQVMTPLSSQIAVLATLKVLQQLGFISFNTGADNSKN